MSGVDKLIDELFPEKGQSGANVSDPGHGHTTYSNWDEDSSDEDKRPRHDGVVAAAAHQTESKAMSKPHITTHHTKAHGGVMNDFDEDSDDEVCGGKHCDGAGGTSLSLEPTAAQKSVFAVPFPSVPSSRLLCCSNRCAVTNLSAAIKHPRPTLAELQSVISGKFDKTLNAAQMMLRKGAYYVHYPSIGNGALDNHGNTTAAMTVSAPCSSPAQSNSSASGSVGTPGGCTNLVCGKCTYVVVRLQGAEWSDAHGTTDLYLTVRNFYPDWSRLACAFPVGQRDAKSLGLVLRPNSNAAAYCCQCSWLTARGEAEVIRTTMAEIVTYKAVEQSTPFATELPLIFGETRRPPLWLCKGHPTS